MKNVLESVLTDSLDERVKAVAGMAWCAAYGDAEVGITLAEAEKALSDGDTEKARELVSVAIKKLRHWHKAHKDAYAILAGYVEKKPEGVSIQ